MPAPHSLFSLGRTELTTPDGGGVRRRKELALLAYLARRAPRPIERDRAMTLLWGDRPDAKARTSFRQAVFEIRTAIGDALVASATEVSVDPALLALDANDFEADCAAGRFRDAVARWQGSFLAGLDDLGSEDWRLWLEGERAALAVAMIRALEHLGAAAEAGGDWSAVAALAERQYELDRSDDTGRRMVSALRRAGQDSRAAAAEARLQLGGAGPAAAGPRAATRGLITPDLMGRTGALGVLRRARAEVASHTGAAAGRVIVIDGPAGMGKSRLIAEFARELAAASPGPTVLTARAFGSQRERRWSALQPLLGTAALTAKGIAAVPPEQLAQLSDVVPELRERFPRLPPAAPGADLRSTAARLLAESAAEHPLVLLVDDAPDADAESEAVLGTLARQAPPGLLLVLAGRSDGWARSALTPDLRRGGTEVQWLTLPPLTETETAGLIASTATFAPAATAALAARLHGLAAGVPGLVHSLLGQLAEARLIGPDADGAWTIRGDLDTIVLGGDADERLLGGLADLTPAARRLLDLSAILGPRIDTAILERAARLDTDTFGPALGMLLAGRHLRQPPLAPDQVEFSSEIARRAVAGALPPSARRALHREAARAYGRSADPRRRAESERHRAAAGASRFRIRVAVAVVTIALAAAAWWQFGPRPSRPVAPGTPVLLADVANQTDEPLFEGSLTVAAQVALQEARRFWVVPRWQVLEALARMNRTDTTATLRGELAREVALRENVPLIIEMDVARRADGYLVTARLIDAKLGSDAASFVARPARRDEVIDAVGEVVSRIRDRLGEARIRPDSMSRLARVTTGSLEALQQYSLGAIAWDRREFDKAAGYWRRATEIDSAFAMAYARLATFSLWLENNRPRAVTWLAAAERHAAAMTEPERLILAGVRATVAGDQFAAVTADQMLAERYPTPDNLFNLATTMFRAGRCADAVPVFHRAAALRPSASVWINLATCYQVLDSLEPALEAYRRAGTADSVILFSANINQEYGLLFLRAGRPEAAESVFRRMAARPDPSSQGRGYRSLAFLASYQGRYRDALAALEQSLSRYRSRGAPLSVFRTLLLAAQSAASLGDATASAEFLAQARTVIGTQPLEPVYLDRIAAAHLRLGDRRGAGYWERRLRREVLAGNRADSVQIRLTAARFAVAGGQAREALRLLAVGPDLAPALLGPYAIVSGKAYAALGRADSALMAWERARVWWGGGSETQDEWERLPLSMASAALVAGDTARARDLLAVLVRRWERADSAAPDVARARLLFGRLEPGH
ncbi:MAG: AAA family ATPase [Gemmatimonadales bacterium]